MRNSFHGCGISMKMDYIHQYEWEQTMIVVNYILRRPIVWVLYDKNEIYAFAMATACPFGYSPMLGDEGSRNSMRQNHEMSIW